VTEEQCGQRPDEEVSSLYSFGYKVQLAHVKLCGINQARLHLGVRQPREQEDLILGKAEQPDITGVLLPATGDATDGQTVVVATRNFRFFLNFLQHRGLHHDRDILLHIGVLFGLGRISL